MQESTESPFTLYTLYGVYETNTRFDCVKLMHVGYVRDIAETVALKFFRKSGCKKDFMIVNNDTKKMISHCLSEQTKLLLNEYRD